MDHHDFTIKSSLLILSISSLILLANGASSSRNNIHAVSRSLNLNHIKEFCQKTSNPNLCAQTIEPHFLHGDLDPFKALEVEVEATHSQTTKTLNLIQTLLAKPDTTKSLKDSLDACKDQYHMILDAIKETKDCMARFDMIDASFKFSAVISYQQTCKDQFEGDAFPLNDDSEAVFELGGNCLDIIADLKKGQEPKNLPPPQNTPTNNIIGTVS
ncbi:pectinesterase inhibitor-like [Abrus precatorius]|uniref:Pectinesterase inhibitor-like n=1 Tax=Abrus precatorius TaxID=3816 RepID=A0A8B8K7D8_ABRPR|nr:pectinesterase inhibitor-like [Abrus precatorius]